MRRAHAARRAFAGGSTTGSCSTVRSRAQFTERLRIGRIEPSRAIAPLGDQPGFFQHLQVLRDGRPADRQALGNRCDRPRRVEDAIENQPPRRIGKRGNAAS